MIAWLQLHWVSLLPVVYVVIDQVAYWAPQFPGNGILHSIELWLKGNNPPAAS